MERAAAPKYNYAMGYLKAFIVVLVVALHAVLAYHPSAPQPPVSLLAHPRWWQAYPVVDSHRAAWAGVFATFNDIFFMALMFFVSGLFVWGSFSRKGARAYLRDRRLRLGLPFIPAAVILAPLAYYPTYLQMTGRANFGGYLRQWISLGSWSAGPVWFVWVLLVFDYVAALLFWLAPGWAESLGRFTAGASRHPALFFAGLVAIGAAVYAPMTLIFGPYTWAAWGPFTFQVSRILLYLVYFLAGVGVGACGLNLSLNCGLLAPAGNLARRWPLWIAAALFAFLAYMFTVAILFTRPLPLTWKTAIQLGLVMTSLLLFSSSCAASGFACLALFVRFAASRSRVFESLTRNSYGIFLIHYAFVSWLAFALLGAALPAIIKFLLVFTGALALSWLATIMIRRIPGAARII